MCTYLPFTKSQAQKNFKKEAIKKASYKKKTFKKSRSFSYFFEKDGVSFFYNDLREDRGELWLNSMKYNYNS